MEKKTKSSDWSILVRFIGEHNRIENVILDNYETGSNYTGCTSVVKAVVVMNDSDASGKWY